MNSKNRRNLDYKIGQRIATCLVPVRTLSEVGEMMGLHRKGVAYIESIALSKIVYRMKEME